MTVTPEDLCAREAIHHVGAIQPHGVLVSVAMPDWTVRHASANAGELFEVDTAALIGESLRDYVDDHVLAQVSDAVAGTHPGAPVVRAGRGNVGAMARLCEVSTHVADSLVHIEIEPQADRAMPVLTAQAMIARLSTCDGADAFDRCVVEQVRQLTGFDRVMLYRFRRDGAGEVVAEDADPAMEPYLGLRYPASDIPPQARELYLRNRIRLIADVAAAPVPVVPALQADGTPLDMGQHALRSVSPVHLEYLRNMGVGASLSVSIIAGGRLWGLVACHHRVARVLPPAVREQAEMFGLFVSMRIAAREQDEALARVEHAQQVRDAIAARLDHADDVDPVLAQALGEVAALFEGDGALLAAPSGTHAHGRVPVDARALQAWLDDSGPVGLAATDAAEDWGGTAGLAGVIAMRIGADGARLFVFRREQVEDVRWAGDPSKTVSTDDGARIAPRRSFAEWAQTVRGRSVPFTDADMRGADRLARLLREMRRARAGNGAPPEGAQVAIEQHRRQLDALSGLLPGLVHLDDAQARALGEQIAALQAQVQALMRAPAGDGERGA